MRRLLLWATFLLATTSATTTLATTASTTAASTTAASTTAASTTAASTTAASTTAASTTAASTTADSAPADSTAIASTTAASTTADSTPADSASTNSANPTPSKGSESYPSCPNPTATPTKYWLLDQDQTGDARGVVPNAPSSYPVWRNVHDYSATGDGSGDQTPNLQKAIDDDGSNGSRASRQRTFPAEVFLPGGTYQLGGTLTIRNYTTLVGDPLDPPVLKASPDFKGDAMIIASDQGNSTGQHKAHFRAILRNVVIDTTALNPETKITALQWGVPQGSTLANIKIKMPTKSAGHVGIDVNDGSGIVSGFEYQAGITTTLIDIEIDGGAVGIRNSNQLLLLSNIALKECTTGVEVVGGQYLSLTKLNFDTVELGMQISSKDLKDIELLHSNATNSGSIIRLDDSSDGKRNAQLLIIGLSHDTEKAIFVDGNGNEKLSAADRLDRWEWSETPYDPDDDDYEDTGTGRRVDLWSPRDTPPTYAEYASDQIVNVKAVKEHPVKGDGSTDDVESLNAILADNAANCKITYFPQGIYLINDTLKVPPQSRIIGQAWPVIYVDAAALNSTSNALKDPVFDDIYPELRARSPAVQFMNKPRTSKKKYDGEMGQSHVQGVHFFASDKPGPESVMFGTGESLTIPYNNRVEFFNVLSDTWEPLGQDGAPLGEKTTPSSSKDEEKGTKEEKDTILLGRNPMYGAP